MKYDNIFPLNANSLPYNHFLAKLVHFYWSLLIWHYFALKNCGPGSVVVSSWQKVAWSIKMQQFFALSVSYSIFGPFWSHLLIWCCCFVWYFERFRPNSSVFWQFAIIGQQKRNTYLLYSWIGTTSSSNQNKSILIVSAHFTNAKLTFLTIYSKRQHNVNKFYYHVE